MFNYIYVSILPLMYKIIFVKPKRNKARIGNNANFILSMCIVIDQQNILNLSDWVSIIKPASLLHVILRFDNMVMPVVDFSGEGYKIRKIFA